MCSGGTGPTTRARDGSAVSRQKPGRRNLEAVMPWDAFAESVTEAQKRAARGGTMGVCRSFTPFDGLLSAPTGGSRRRGSRARQSPIQNTPPPVPAGKYNRDAEGERKDKQASMGFDRNRLTMKVARSALRYAIPRTRRATSRVDRRPRLGCLPVHSLLTGACAMGKAEAALPGSDVPSRPVLQTPGQPL
jgi:hypothetical protein